MDELDDELRLFVGDRPDRGIKITIDVLRLPDGVYVRDFVGEQIAIFLRDLLLAAGECLDIVVVGLLAVGEGLLDRVKISERIGARLRVGLVRLGRPHQRRQSRACVAGVGRILHRHLDFGKGETSLVARVPGREIRPDDAEECLGVVGKAVGAGWAIAGESDHDGARQKT